MQKIGKFVATLFFVGYIPLAPGTIASMIAIAIYLIVKNNIFLYCSLTLSLLILGFWSANVCEKEFSKKDPPQIVVDEFSSTFLVYLFIPYNLRLLVTGFVLFRFFDIFKIPPIKKLQLLPRGWGIMLDDITSAILTNIILQVLLFSKFLY